MTISTQDAFADRAKAHLRNWGADTRHGHVEMLTAFAEAEALRAPRQPLEADLAATLDRIVTEYPVNHGSTFCKNLAEAALRWYRVRPASPPSPQETRRALEPDLILRCRELLEWSATGLLAGGNGGALRALADRLEKQIGPNYALNVAESQTRDEAMRAVVALSTSPAPAEDVRTALHPYGKPVAPITPGTTWEDHLAAEVDDAKAH